MSYLGSTDGNPQPRTAKTLVAPAGERFAETDIDKSWAWVKGFAQFPRKSGENVKDFWPLSYRVTTRPEALSMETGEAMIFPQAQKDLILREKQPPIALSALETKQ